MGDSATVSGGVAGANGGLTRSDSISHASENSQTAEEYISSQLQLEADAREALPYQFDSCTRPLGPLRQILFSCLTCNPPPASPSDPYTPAGVCYSCSISCHGEHTLVELFNKRNFVCDCGTTRLPSTSPCTLRLNEETQTKGGVHSEKPTEGNKYNQNFRNRFCGCGEDYNAHQEKGTMFQCLGLGTEETGGCGEDWWHPECIAGLERGWYKKAKNEANESSGSAVAASTAPESMSADQGEDIPTEAPKAAEDGDPPVPPGFPDEDDFEYLICYKCVRSNPWIKRYSGAEGFLKGMPFRPTGPSAQSTTADNGAEVKSQTAEDAMDVDTVSRKRKAADEPEEENASQQTKRSRNSPAPADGTVAAPDANPEAPTCKYARLSEASSDDISLFLKDDFRDHLCRCPSCFPKLKEHPQLLEEEDTFEPPISEDGDEQEGGGGSVGSRSILDRGEAALSNVDRVRAIEGVMAYNHLKDKVKTFLKPFAESGQPVGAEDVKAYFEKLRGDAEAIKAAAGGAEQSSGDGGDGKGDQRKEQGGY